MRIELTLRYPRQSALPFNYEYLLSAVVYKTLAQADPTFADWLHERGYDRTGRNFKLFHFSRLNLPYVRHHDGALQLAEGRNAGWKLGFCVDETLEKFVLGLFRQHRFGVGDGSLRPVDFNVEQVSVLPPPVFTDVMRFRTQSPLHLSTQREGDRYAHYMSPEEEGYAAIFFENLRRKWVEARALPLESGLDLLPDCRLWVHSMPKRKMVNVKGTDIIGYLFDFEVRAPADWLAVGYDAGFGAMGSQGFGWCELNGE